MSFIGKLGNYYFNIILIVSSPETVDYSKYNRLHYTNPLDNGNE